MVSNPTLTRAYQRIFACTPEILAHAPGRVNLIGEHTDYNQGFVFPAAINFGTWVAASRRNDSQVNAIALDYAGQRNEFSIDNIEHDDKDGWSNYVRGVLKVLKMYFPEVKGADLVITGNIPQGAGLSSSASFEIALLSSYQKLYNLSLDGVQAALIGQEAENTFVGCSCGIMDQLISAMGKQGQAMILDCQSLSMEHTPLPEDLKIVIINSNVKRGLVDSEYNLRRAQCERAAAILDVTSLREADLALLESKRESMDDLLYRRARHIITDNMRTLKMFDALKKNNVAMVSQIMADSHASMRDDFEITVQPIDILVEIISGVLGDKGGVRMTGGGFGGCVIALVPSVLVNEVIKMVEKVYYRRTGYKQTVYICSAEQGAFSE